MVSPAARPSERSRLSFSSLSFSSVRASASFLAISNQRSAVLTADVTPVMPSAASKVSRRRLRASELVARRLAMPMWLCASAAT